MSVTAQAEIPGDWGALARREGGFYHEPEWLDGLASTFGLRLHVLTERDPEGTLTGGLALAEIPRLFGPRRLVSFPFSYACGPISSTPGSLAKLGEAAVELARARGIARIEVKHRPTAPPPAAGFERVEHYATFRIPGGLEEDEVWKRLHASSTRRSIRKAQKSGLEVEEGGDDPGAWRAMALLQDDSSRRHGMPSPPHDFFTGFCARLARVGKAQLLLARGSAGVVAAIVVWLGARERIYAFGASQTEALDLRPNHMLIWRAINESIRAGADFDLGRAAPEQAGLTEFKRRWGAERLPLAYDYWPHAFGLNAARRDTGMLAAGARAWAVLPTPIARLGSFLYRYLG